METAFYIILNIKTPSGFESFGKICIGKDSQSATTLFRQLSGLEPPCDDCALQLDLVELRDGLPVNLQVLGCTLQQLAENIKLITKETFKALNMGDL